MEEAYVFGCVPKHVAKYEDWTMRLEIHVNCFNFPGMISVYLHWIFFQKKHQNPLAPNMIEANVHFWFMSFQFIGKS